MKALSVVSQAVTPSPIREMFNRALGMEGVIRFTVGEPDFPTPDHIVDAAVAALRRGEHKYTPNAGILPLRQAIAQRTNQTHRLEYAPAEEIIVTTGGMEALLLTMMTILDPGDEVLLGDPSWTNYSRQVLICSAAPRFVQVDAAHDFLFAPEALEAAITDKTKAVIINSPANPTGSIGSREVLERLANIIIRHDLWVISDEVYRELVYDGNAVFSMAMLPGMRERTVVVNSFSKTYAMTGWRVGYALGPACIIGNMVKLQENVSACVNSAAQYGALAALEGPREPVDRMVRAYGKRRQMVLDGLASLPGLSCYAPQGAFYALVDISATGMKAEAFAMDLLEKARVIVVPGHAFGDTSDKYVRLSFAASEETIREGIRRIRKYMLGKIG